MATKYQLMTELYQSTLDDITSNQDNWRKFLRSACHNYNCRFDEQVLIYVQRPDAKAVLELEKWNKLFGRWVNRGATGIAVFDDEHNGRARLKHYFDISDTHAGRFSRSVPLWDMQERYEDEVIEVLENSFGTLEYTGSMDTALTSVAANVVEDNYQDYLQELLTCQDDSFLEELDELNVKVFFKNALEYSISYMLLERCLGDADAYIQDMDFSVIGLFNTRETVNALGIATSDMAQMVLKEVALTVRGIQRQEQNANRTFDESRENEYPVNKQKQQSERSFEDGTDLQQTGRLQPAQSPAATGAGASPWEIRFDAPDVSKGEPQSDLHEPADIGQAEPSSDGDRTDGTDKAGAADHTDDESRGRDGGAESHQPDEVGGTDEQHPAGSGGNDTGRADLQLDTTEEAGNDSLIDSDELPAFLDETLFIGIIANKEDDLIYKKSQIELFFSMHPEEQERADYLKSAYQDRYTETLVDGQRVGYKPQDDGLLMWKGSYLSRSEESVLSWGLVAEFVAQLIDQKEYFINRDIKSLKDMNSQQMSLFDYGNFNTPESDNHSQISLFKGFEISQQIIDEALCLSGNEPECLERICAYFAKDYPLEQNAAFLRQEYGRDGKGFYSGTHLISLWFDENGIRIARGRTAEGNSATVLSWEDAAKRIRELLDMGRYVPQSVLDNAAANERTELSASLWYNVQDFSEEASEAKLLPTVLEIYNSRDGFPENTAQIAELLKDPDQVEILISEMTEFIGAYENNRELLRFHFHRPGKTLEQLQGLQRPQLTFTVQPDFSYEPKQFITNDEIDRLLIGGGNVQHSKFRIYSYFLEEHTPKERADFLKNEYGTGGSGRLGFNTNYDSKGIEYSRGDLFHPYDKVLLKWNQVEKRIGQLIKENRYMSEQELAYIPTYEKEQIAREVYSFFSNVPQEQPRPYPYGFDHHNGVSVIEEQLTDSTKVEEIYQMMLPVWEQTAADDRHHATRQRAFQDLTAYREGTFSLFGEKKSPAMPPAAQEQPTEEERPDYHALAVRLNRISRQFEPIGFFNREDTEETRIARCEQQLQDAGSLSAILGELQLNLDLLDPEEELAIDMELLMEELQELISDTELPERSDEPEPAAKPEPEPEPEPANELTVGTRLTIDGRDFEIDRINTEWDTVSLRDVTFQNGTGFPIFRSESIAFVRVALAEYNKSQNLQELVSDKLSESGWTVTDETVQTGIEEYHARGGKGNFEDAADFIEDEILSGEPESEISEDTLLLPTKTAIPAPPKARRERVYFTDIHPEIPREQRRNFRITDPELGNGTPSEKFAANIAAIRTLKQIEDEDRLATPEEQEILSRYVGWGGLASCFEETHMKNPELKNRLTEEEYAAARESTLTAFYTSPVIVESMYKALGQMGFQTGNILEPSCGIGNFIGMIPDSMAGSKAYGSGKTQFYGIELDSISGRIARQLYQNSSIAVNGYEKVDIPDSFFDVAIGNVPFGDFKVLDRRYDKNKWLIHDYFFGKTLDKVRPGGIVAFITSKGTLDKENPAVRKYLAQRADLIGAIRLPNNAFKRNAGTEVTSDIIFLQKRDRMTDIEPDWVHLDTVENARSPGDSIKMNSYFVQHPDMILGEMVMESTQFGMDSACKAYEDVNLSEQLSEAISNLHAQISEYEVDELEEDEDLSIPADPAVRNFSYTIAEGKLYFRENSRMHPVEMSVTAENRIRGMIAIRDCVRTLIQYQSEDYPDEMIQGEQTKLNRLYDDYTRKYGLLCSRGNSLAFGEDSSFALLCSLEILDDEGNFERKADMFSKRTIKPHVPVTSVDTASEALAVSISEKARVDMAYMSELSGKTEQELETELHGVIFRDVVCATEPADIPESAFDLTRYPLVPADEYLSGNVRKKLQMLRALEKALPAEEKNKLKTSITALEAVQPADLTASEIGVRIGATWIPPDIYQKFMFELFDTGSNGRRRMNVLYSKYSGEWNITDKNSDFGNIKSVTTYGTKRINAYHILEQTLNLKDVRIFDTIIEDGTEKRVLNKKETAIAQDRQELIKSKFTEWLWKDIDRREMLCKIYNETFNSTRPREYDGQHITFHGMNPEITLRKHQINAIAHVMYGGNTLLAHQVGAGKTYEMVAAAMESKRLGLCSKSLVVVPNHITEQWAAEWLQLYPAANILVATKKDFQTRNRKKFCARIATGEYDAVIIGHSQFEKIPMSRERQQAILERQIHELMSGIEEARSSHAERYTIKQMEKTKKSLETRLAKLNDQTRKDNVVTFEELGVDRIFIDESHYFKNLFLLTKMRNVGGIAQTEAQKSSDLFMKTQYLNEITGDKGVIFATGTPISNSMVELYTIQRYLQYSVLQENGMQHFDEWAANFGETVTAIELSPEGTGYRAKTRFAKFYNLPELMATFKEVADIQTADMLKLPVPKANFHTEVIKPSELQQEMVAGLAERAENIRGGGVDPSIDNMLRITNDGRKLALDMRLVNPLAPDDENGKVAVCARNIYRIWEETTDKRSAQLAFCDLSTPKKDGSFSVYDDLKAKLMEKGIPEEEIAFIHDANTEVRKKELFAKVRSGQVRVLMGSTQKMGAGTNVQDRLIALHDCDCPWRPSDLEQRLGRIVRQGNSNPEVEIYRYVTEGTFDSYLYQLVENKQKFISQIMTSKTPLRAAEDVDESALNYAEIKALATGNPMIIEKCNLDMEVGKLNMLKANHLSQRYALEEMVLRKYPESIARLSERVDGYEKDVQLVSAHPKLPDTFPGMEILGITHTEKEAAGKAILDACTKMTGSDAVYLGQYRGFSMTLAYDGTSNEYRLTLKGTLSHTAVLGADVHGNITRADNVLEGLAGKLDNVKEELANTEVQLDNARAEMNAPFSKEAELEAKTARLKELNILLNMDEKDRSLVNVKLEALPLEKPKTVREQER